jgi:subtilisin family serine protease
MIVTKIRQPIPVAAQIAVLSLGVSAMPFLVRADEALSAEPWVWGVAAREAAVAEAYVPILDTLAARERKPKTPEAPPTPPVPPAPPVVMGDSGDGIGTQAASTGAGVLIAILDTGIDLDHPEFAGRISANSSCFGGSACDGAAALGDDDNGHGTHVAGIAAAAADSVGTTGVAPDAELLSVKVLAASGAGAYGYVAQGISFAAWEGAQVINLSLGGPRPTNATEYNMLVSALSAAAETSVIVAAAGNNGNGRIPEYPAVFATLPEIAGSMIIAGSLQPNGTRASRFSNTPGSGCSGPRNARVCLMDVFLMAPGEKITSTLPDGTYGEASGTSMAAPYISGAAALVWSAAPYLTPEQVTAILFESAIDLGKPGKDPVYGRGLVNPAGAIAPLGSLSVATSGTTTFNASGTGDVKIAQLSGVLASGLRSSHAARDLTFFDDFGRDYRVDLTKSIASSAVSFGGVFGDGPALRRATYFGDGITASAWAGAEDGSIIAFSGRDDVRVSDVRDAVLRARLSEDTSVTIGYRAAAAGRMNQLDLAASEAYDGLFLSASAMNSPYLGFASDASLVAATIDVTDDVSLAFGHASRESDPLAPYEDEILTLEERLALLRQDRAHLASGEGSTAALSWRVAPWGLVGFNVAYTGEDNALFGALEGGALALTAEASTASAGAGARVNLGSDWVASASWNAGVSRVVPLAGGLFANVSELHTEAYGVALAKRGIFGAADAIGFGVSRPLHVVEGQAVMIASTGVTRGREIVYTTETINLASATPETDLEFGYTAALGPVTFLQVNAIYQMDLGGVQGEEAIAGLATVSTQW